MSFDSLWRLAQFKLDRECMRTDHKLLRVVGHANFLHSLSNLGDEQAQRFERGELAVSDAREEPRPLRPDELYTMNEEMALFTSPSIPINLSNVPVVSSIPEEDEGDGEDVEESGEKAPLDKFTLADIASQNQVEPGSPYTYTHPEDFSERDKNRIKINPCADPHPVMTIYKQTAGMLDSREATMAAILMAEIHTSINLDKYYERAGFIFNK